MQRYYSILGCVILIFLFVFNANAYIVDPNGSTIGYGESWDSPQDEIEGILASLGDDTSLTLVNGIADEIESWYAMGATTIILEEIAGYAAKTDFGWYSMDSSGNIDADGQLFDGPEGKLTEERSIVFTTLTHFGFYIDPNGISDNRMFTEHSRNGPHEDYQVTIWQVNDSPYDFILGWEDLPLNGDDEGDRDYQDMILSVKIKPIPEPANMFLMGTGLLGLAALGRRRFFKR